MFQPDNIKTLKMKWGSKYNIVQLTYKGHFTRNQIRTTAQDVSDELARKKFKGRVMVSMLYPQGYRGNQGVRVNPEKEPWRAPKEGKAHREAGDKVTLFSMQDYYDDPDVEDPKYYSQFRIYLERE